MQRVRMQRIASRSRNGGQQEPIHRTSHAQWLAHKSSASQVQDTSWEQVLGRTHSHGSLWSRRLIDSLVQPHIGGIHIQFFQDIESSVLLWLAWPFPGVYLTS